MANLYESREALTQDKRILRRALALIRKGWCQNAEARTAGGTNVDYISPRATAFCAIGAIRRAQAAETVMVTDYGRARRRLAVVLGGPRDAETIFNYGLGPYDAALAAWNDDARRTKREVVRAFSEAIKTVTAEITRAREAK